MELQNKATSLWGNFFNVKMVQIRTFHMMWFAFFRVCFFAWFRIAPLMSVVRDELQLTRIRSAGPLSGHFVVFRTLVYRLALRPDRGHGNPTCSLLLLGSLPVRDRYGATETFLSFRVLIRCMVHHL
jgi:NNP family nitrate/nitrite transporter-like MFS transporter